MNRSPVSLAYSYSPTTNDIFSRNYDEDDEKSNSTIDEPNRTGERSRCPSDDTDDSCAANNYFWPTFRRKNDFDYDFQDMDQIQRQVNLKSCPKMTSGNKDYKSHADLVHREQSDLNPTRANETYPLQISNQNNFNIKNSSIFDHVDSMPEPLPETVDGTIYGPSRKLSQVGAIPSSIHDLWQNVRNLAALSWMDEPLATSELANPQALSNISALAQINEMQLREAYLKRQRQIALQTLFPPPPIIQMPPPHPMPLLRPRQDDVYGPKYSEISSGFDGRPVTHLGLAAPAVPDSGDRGQIMHLRCKFGQLGHDLGHLHTPHGFCFGSNQEIVVADTYNNRIQIFDQHGNCLFVFGRAGKEEGHLWQPRKVAVFQNGYFVVCDKGSGRSRMQIFNEQGYFVRSIFVGFIEILAGIVITEDGLIVAIDSVRPTIYFLNPVSGQLVRKFKCDHLMKEPSDIAIFNNDFYVCDFKGDSVLVISPEGELLRFINLESISTFPNGIDISDKGDIVVCDSHGNNLHVAVFDRQGEFVAHFHCPSIKLSRCCGLKLTPKGYIVTLAKNNHHVLVLDTLYVA